MATNPMVIPSNERYPRLKEFLLQHADMVAQIRKAHPVPLQQPPLTFFILSLPWLVDMNLLTTEQRQNAEQRKMEALRLGFDGEASKRDLENVLKNDRHLAECCPTVLHLASFLENRFFSPAAEALRGGASKERLDHLFEDFEILAYHQGRFKRIALSHIFNFDMKGNSTTVAGHKGTPGDVRIERLDASTIPFILGEPGFQAFLHPPEIGNCFVIEEQEGASEVNDFDWLTSKRAKAATFAMVLQYFKDGVVHLGYTVPVFQPNWVNQVRRSGLFFLGNPQRLPYAAGNKPYVIEEAEKERLNSWWKAATTHPIAAALAKTTGKLREAIYRAAIYYESSHEKESDVDRLISLAIALEALFSPPDKGEFTFRISQAVAQFLGENVEERQRIFSDVKGMYSRRSELFHGTYNVEKYNKGEFVSAPEIERWSCLIRRALLGFLVLYLGGEQERQAILERIATAAFDPAAGEALRHDSSPARVLEKMQDASDGSPQPPRVVVR